MGTKPVRVEEKVLERIKARKREGETLSDTIERLIRGPSLLDLAGLLTEEEAEEAKEAIRVSREADLEKEKRLSEKIESEGGEE